MQVTVEISLYPLTEKFEQIVISYIHDLKKIPNLKVDVNGLSTQIFGEYDHVMSTLSELNKKTLAENKCVLLMKMAAGEKSVENLPDTLK